MRPVPTVTFKPIAEASHPGRVLNSLRRGHLVRVAGRKAPQIITASNWKRGIQCADWDGERLASRPLRNAQERTGSARYGERTEHAAQWYPLSKVTHYAAR